MLNIGMQTFKIRQLYTDAASYLGDIKVSEVKKLNQFIKHVISMVQIGEKDRDAR